MTFTEKILELDPVISFIDSADRFFVTDIQEAKCYGNRTRFARMFTSSAEHTIHNRDPLPIEILSQFLL